MKIYTHDYSLPSAAESLLYKAQKAFAEDAPETALQHINQARELLETYLAGDNIKADADAYGFFKQGEMFDEEQIVIIRDTFGELLTDNPTSNYAWDYLNIINVCQEQMSCPIFDTLEQFHNNKSNSWAEIVEE